MVLAAYRRGGGRVMSAGAGTGASAVREDYLAGKVAVVTGGRGGIGTAVCARFAAEGATVYATGLSEPAAGVGAGADTDAAPGAGANADAGAAAHAAPAPVAGAVVFHRHDVTSEESTVVLMARVSREHGRLDVLVNAAGIEIEKTVEHTSLDEWNRIFAVNVTGTFLTSKHALPLMRRAGGGSIVNFGSYDGFIADPNLARLLCDQGRGACADARDGLRPRGGQHPRQRDLPRLRGHSDAEELLRREGRCRGREHAGPRRASCIRSGATAPPRTWRTSSTGSPATKPATQPASSGSLDGGISAQVQQMRI